MSLRESANIGELGLYGKISCTINETPQPSTANARETAHERSSPWTFELKWDPHRTAVIHESPKAIPAHGSKSATKAPGLLKLRFDYEAAASFNVSKGVSIRGGKGGSFAEFACLHESWFNT